MSPSKHPCPRCSAVGRSVGAVTLRGVLKPEALERLDDLGGFRFCATPGCGLAYYGSSEQTVELPELRVRVGVKETHDPRPLCYCFDFTARDIESAVRTHGVCSIPDEITEKCRAGLDRCEETNPRGACCLGDVRRCLRVVRDELDLAPAKTPEGPLPSCCDTAVDDE